MFQIWFDPDLTKTLEKPASYDDYRAADFPQKTENGTTVKTLAGPGSPFRMDPPGVEVFQIEMENGSYLLPAEAGKIYSAYVIEGEVSFNGETARQSDFVQVTEADNIKLESLAGTKVFVIGMRVTEG